MGKVQVFKNKYIFNKTGYLLPYQIYRRGQYRRAPGYTEQVVIKHSIICLDKVFILAQFTKKRRLQKNDGYKDTMVTLMGWSPIQVQTCLTCMFNGNKIFNLTRARRKGLGQCQFSIYYSRSLLTQQLCQFIQKLNYKYSFTFQIS